MTKRIPIDRPTENWTRFPNCILDNLIHFTAAECKILNLMVRKNIGYTQPNKQFAVVYFMQKLGMAKGTVITAVNGLLNKKSIKVVKTGPRGIRHFDINWKKPLVQKLNRSKNWTRSGSKIGPDPVQKLDPLKENNKRKQKKENNMAPSEHVSSSKGGSMKHPGLTTETKKLRRSELCGIAYPEGYLKSGKPPKIGGGTDCVLFYGYVTEDSFNEWDNMKAGDVARLLIGMFHQKKYKHSYTYKVLSVQLKKYIVGNCAQIIPALIDVYENPKKYNTDSCIGYLFNRDLDYKYNPFSVLHPSNIVKVINRMEERARKKSGGNGKARINDGNVISYIIENGKFDPEKMADKKYRHAIAFYLEVIVGELIRDGVLDKVLPELIAKPRLTLKSLPDKYLKGNEKVFDYV